MQSKVFAFLLVPMLALAVSNMTPVTTVPDEQPVATGEPVVQTDGREPGEARFLVGTVDTIGGSTYDWQSNGPIYTFIVNSPGYGVHVLWMYSADASGTTFPDRNMRYNFYDYSAGAWNWIDPDYMQSGVNVFTERVGYGNMCADPTTGVAVVSGHLGTPLRVEVARDMAPGAGIFEYCTGSPTLEGYLWPPLALDQNSGIHIHCIEDVGDRDNNYYAGGETWCSWSSPVRMAPPQPDPMFPDQTVAASKVSDKVCLTWVYSPDGYSQKPGFYRISTDAGASWENTEQLYWPPAYQGDTLPSFHITSLFPFYDKDDDLHIVANVAPFVRDTNYILPVEIWHYNAQTDGWTMIHRADPESLMAAVGYNAVMACRPSIGEDNAGNLIVTWEEFDGVNVEQQTNLLRGDVWAARGNADGSSWGEALRLTGPGASVSSRFPSIIDLMVQGSHYTTDTVMILYEIEQVAGFVIQGEGPHTDNPFVVHKLLVGDLPEPPGAVGEGKTRLPSRAEVTALPNPLGDRTVISYAVPRATEVSLVVYDAAGRPVETLHKGSVRAGRYSATWNAEEVPAGIYFYTLEVDDTSLSEKLVVTH